MRIFSTFLPDLSALDSIEAGEMNGANVSTARLLQFWISEPRLDILEVFLPASMLADHAELARIAAAFLPSWRIGQGALRFYAFHHAERVWATADPLDQRAILSVDAVYFPALRAIRDRWAQGPLPIFSEVYALSAQALWNGFAPLLSAPPAPFDTLVCRARDTQKVFEKFMAKGVAFAPFRTIYSHTPLDLSRFRPADAAQKQEIRARLGWPQDKTIAVLMGRLNPYSKGDLLPLLRVWSRAAGCNDVLVLAGEAWPASYAQVVEDEARRLEIEVILTGRVAMKDQTDCFRAADLALVVAETLVDVAPMTVCEAQACELPVIASDWTGTRDRIAHGENGFLVPTHWMPGLEMERFSILSPTLEQTLALAQSVGHDEVVWENCLRVLLENPALRAQMRQAALQRATRDSGWEVVSQIWLDAWDESDAMARAETSEQREKRCHEALSWANWLDYDAQFSHYASEITPDDAQVVLSVNGRDQIEGGETLFVYSDLQPLIYPAVFDFLLNVLNSANASLSLVTLCDQAAAKTGCAPTEVRFHLALLRKRGWITLEVPVGKK
jgi:glycosyltransferase involved in cell wall biosynthesis